MSESIIISSAARACTAEIDVELDSNGKLRLSYRGRAGGDTEHSLINAYGIRGSITNIAFGDPPRAFQQFPDLIITTEDQGEVRRYTCSTYYSAQHPVNTWRDLALAS